ncbi:MAG: hypothetical protein ACRDN6_14825 [Gaiellaceae bacterium]
MTALALIPGPASGAEAQRGANSVTFRDSSGEDAAGPDITTVTVSNNDAGAIVFRINVPNRPTLTQDMLVGIDVDTDGNASTGAPPLGLDYAIELNALRPPAEVNLFRWDGTNFTRRAGDPPASSLIFSYSGGAVTIEIGARELGNAKRFNFAVSVVTGIVVNPDTGEPDGTNARFDAAPDSGHGLWNYEVKTAPLRLVARSFGSMPAKPRAGKTFTVRLAAARSDTGAVLASGEVRCVARVGGRTLTARTHRIVNKRAVCVWLIPATAAGQTIRGSVTVVFEGLRVTRSFAATVG